MVEERSDTGNIKISDEAIATIAAIAARSVPGVLDLDGGPMSNFAGVLGVKKETSGIKVEMEKESVSLDINIIVEFGMDISEIASSVQEKIRQAIEKMTGLMAEKVNVNINSVKLPQPVKNPE